jgi:hypothetical protein
MESLRARLRPLAHAALALFVVVAVPRHALVLHVHDGGDLPHVHPDGALDDHDHDQVGDDRPHHAHDDDGRPAVAAPEHASHAHWQEPFQRAAAPAAPAVQLVVHALRVSPPAAATPPDRARLAARSRGPPAPGALVHV